MSAREVELKALVERPAEVAARIETRGAVRTFRGRMSDHRYDLPSRALESRDEVLRVRTFTAACGSAPRPAEVAWKGPTRQASGYKEREELEFAVADSGPVEAILAHLGLTVIDAIDRCVEVYRMDDAALRLEWYPRMDVLLEVEGPPAAIEAAVAATGMPRTAFTADRLVDFGVRYQRRTGTAPALNLEGLGGGQPGWPAWAR
ncbi:MAG TPA: class IV adenylate cyclase [Gemmatimonadales bacterium]|nr:class IV adenylate cyclase [Gemmatimonadales bacterium]